MDMVLTQFFELFLIYIPLTLLVAGVYFIIAKLLAKKKKCGKLKPLTVIIYSVFTSYIFMLIYMTLMDNGLMAGGAGGINLIPFNFGDPTDKYYHLTIGYGIFGNILLFIPFGLLIPFIIKRRRIYCFVAPLVSSIAIEIIQIPIGRTCDINDVIFNEAGTCIGIGIFFILYFIKTFITKRTKGMNE